MAKIKITESELKQLIRESVETVMGEATGMQNRRNQRYLDAQNAYNAAQTSWANAPQNVKDEYTERLRNNPNYKFNSPEELYNSDMQTKVSGAKRRLDRATRRNGLQFQQQLKQKEAATQTLKRELDSYIQKSQDLTNQVKQLTNQVANLEGEKKNLIAKNGQLVKANQNLTAQIKTLASKSVQISQPKTTPTTSIQTTAVPNANKLAGRPTATPGTTPGTAPA
jgi:chromosome segregation ATPase